MPRALIQLDDVHVAYPTKDGPARRILDGLDLEIHSGEFVSVVGQTGCGKSTLLRLILGEQRPTRGRVLVNGCERSQPDRLCGYVPQKYALFSDKTVLDNVTFGPDVAAFGAFPIFHPRRRKRMREFRAEAMVLLRQMGLHDSDARKYPHQLSGGMQQRVAIAQALIMRPPILLMDEAFSALDPATRRGMQRLIKEVWSRTGTTIVFVTHNTHEAVCLGSRLIALGGSAVLDVAIPHFDFDSDEGLLRSMIEEVEARATDGNVGLRSLNIQKRSFVSAALSG